MNVALWILVWNALSNIAVAILLASLALWIKAARQRWDVLNRPPAKALELAFLTLGACRLVQAVAVITTSFWIIPYANLALVGVLTAISWLLWTGRWRSIHGGAVG